MTARERPIEDKWRPTYEAIGRRLKWARELVYPTQSEFARVLEIDKGQVSKVERGERAMSLITLIYAANKLRTGSDYLLFGELAGVDRELRTLLIQRHPELLQEQALPIQPKRQPYTPPWAETHPERYLIADDRDRATRAPDDNCQPRGSARTPIRQGSY